MIPRENQHPSDRRRASFIWSSAKTFVLSVLRPCSLVRIEPLPSSLAMSWTNQCMKNEFWSGAQAILAALREDRRRAMLALLHWRNRHADIHSGLTIIIKERSLEPADCKAERPRRWWKNRVSDSTLQSQTTNCCTARKWTGHEEYLACKAERAIANKHKRSSYLFHVLENKYSLVYSA